MFYRPLPGAGGGSAGPAYDDTDLRNAIFRDDGPYVAAPLRSGETATYRVTVPLGSGTFRDLGLTESADFIVAASATTVTIPVTPDDSIGSFIQALFLRVKAPIGFAWTGAGFPVEFTSSGGALAFTPNPVTKALGLATGGITSRIPAIWQGGEILRVPEDFQTLEAALAMAGSRFALPGAFVDVSVADGRHERTATINLDNARLGHVRVRGRSAPDVWTGAASYTVSGSAKAWSVTVPVSTAFAALCVVDDFILVEVTSNYGSEVNRNCLQGYFRVTGKTSNSVTLFVTAYPTLSGATANLKMTRFRSVFWCVDVEFATAADAVLPAFENLGIVRSTRTTTWTAINLVRSKMANSADLAIADFGYSLWLSGPGCEFRGQLVVGTGSPVIYNDAVMALRRCVIGGCNGDSVSIGSGGRFVVDSDTRHSFIGGSNNVGIYAGNRGSFLIRGDDMRVVGQFSTSIVANDRSNGHLGPSVAYGSISPAIGVTGNNNSSITVG
ncbi:hypothetical protein H9Q09_11940 [Aurantimonas sp. DM33-3]|uniref:hypothetical protein n=1 Tax=Aurantimonas sp. DM33-3 TaxID=2766955 RepID=UPI00165267E1|nr:hypothetical protein [Aurantimonas sp. DM33-3]MBC6716919.1 hypothetical protein [Aurantimonas sp. DM33-3]